VSGGRYFFAARAIWALPERIAVESAAGSFFTRDRATRSNSDWTKGGVCPVSAKLLRAFTSAGLKTARTPGP